MIRKVFEIMLKDYDTVDAFCGIRRVQDIAEKNKTDCFPVTDNGKIIGVLTRSDLIKTHPNRIVLDAMSGSYKYIEADESVWEAKELLEGQGTDILLATQDDKIIGIVTKNAINVEISKHIDLLTGLYKSDYIIYNCLKFLEHGSEISIVFFDVNNFGYIDKEFGHTVGDNILKEIAQILKDNAPEGTYLCRYGGDEFALLTEVCAENCKALAQDILNKVKQHEFYGNIHIGISAGIAGGERRNPRKGNMYKTVTNLINLASLASTKAKKEKDNLVLGYSGIIDEIAI
ncbi:GGDEF domain-containing protein [Bacillota bacterium LX-D]|nr:GGDEF domain-containing protein [Bacillota bacterium LX-D]